MPPVDVAPVQSSTTAAATTTTTTTATATDGPKRRLTFVSRRRLQTGGNASAPTGGNASAPRAPVYASENAPQLLQRAAALWFRSAAVGQAALSVAPALASALYRGNASDYHQCASAVESGEALAGTSSDLCCFMLRTHTNVTGNTTTSRPMPRVCLPGEWAAPNGTVFESFVTSYSPATNPYVLRPAESVAFGAAQLAASSAAAQADVPTTDAVSYQLATSSPLEDVACAHQSTVVWLPMLRTACEAEATCTAGTWTSGSSCKDGACWCPPPWTGPACDRVHSCRWIDSTSGTWRGEGCVVRPDLSDTRHVACECDARVSSWLGCGSSNGCNGCNSSSVASTYNASHSGSPWRLRPATLLAVATDPAGWWPFPPPRTPSPSPPPPATPSPSPPPPQLPPTPTPPPLSSATGAGLTNSAAALTAGDAASSGGGWIGVIAGGGVGALLLLFCAYRLNRRRGQPGRLTKLEARADQLEDELEGKTKGAAVERPAAVPKMPLDGAASGHEGRQMPALLRQGSEAKLRQGSIRLACSRRYCCDDTDGDNAREGPGRDRPAGLRNLPRPNLPNLRHAPTPGLEEKFRQSSTRGARHRPSCFDDVSEAYKSERPGRSFVQPGSRALPGPHLLPAPSAIFSARDLQSDMQRRTADISAATGDAIAQLDATRRNCLKRTTPPTVSPMPRTSRIRS